MDGPIPILASILLKTVAPARWCVISSSVGLLCMGRLSARFRSLGSRQTLRPPPRFSVNVRMDTQSVGSVIFVITPMVSILEISCLIASLRWIAYLRLGCTRGVTVGSGTNRCGPLKSPIIASNLVGNIFLRSEMPAKLTLSGPVTVVASALMSSHWSLTTSSCLQLVRPKIAGPSDSAMKNCRSCQPEYLELQP